MTERPTAISALSKQGQDTQRRTRTITYGNVVSYNPAQRQAHVQLGRMLRSNGGTPFPMAVLPACPVAWPRFAGMVMEGRLNPGDPVLVLVSDREMAPWMSSGVAPVPPVKAHMHKLADAIVLAGILPSGRVAEAGPANPAEMWIGKANRLAGISIQIDGPQLTIEAPTGGNIRLGRGATQPAVLGTRLMTAITAMLTAGAGVVSPGTPNWAAAQTAWNTAIGVSNPLSLKVVVE